MHAGTLTDVGGALWPEGRACEWRFCATQAAVDARHTVSPRATRRCSASIDSGHSMLIGWLGVMKSVPSSTGLLLTWGHNIALIRN